MINPTPSSEMGAPSQPLGINTDLYKKVKAKIETFYRMSIGILVVGAIILSLGLLLLTGPVGIGVVVGLAATGSVLLLAGLISFLIFKLSRTQYDVMVFKSALVLGDQIRQEFIDIVNKGIQWKQLDEDFMKSASVRVLYSCSISNILLTDFRFLFTDKVLLDRTNPLMEMLFHVSSDYYAVKNVCRQNPQSSESDIQYYEEQFYIGGTRQSELRREYNRVCAKFQSIFSEKGATVINLFSPDLLDSEREWFSEMQRDVLKEQEMRSIGDRI